MLFGSENAKAVAVMSESESMWMVDEVDGEDVPGEGAVEGRCIVVQESKNTSNCASLLIIRVLIYNFDTTLDAVSGSLHDIRNPACAHTTAAGHS